MTELITWKIPVKVDTRIGEPSAFAALATAHPLGTLEIDGVVMQLQTVAPNKYLLKHPAGLCASFDLTPAVKTVASNLHLAAEPGEPEEL